MTTASTPNNPSIENLRKQAKTLKKAWQNGEAAALRRIRSAHPQYASATDEALTTTPPRLTDCQLVIARELGHQTWRELTAWAQLANQDLPHEFVSLACLCYDDPHYDHRSFHTRAHTLLRRNPWLVDAGIWAASAAGNAAAVEAQLRSDPGLVNKPGPYGWVPLLCACYSRVRPLKPTHSTLEVARILLDHGADPNAYTLKGNADQRLDQTPRRFTALTGLFGGGSTGLENQPPHPRLRQFAELLLQYGADPADEEALDHGHYDKSPCLEILLRHGLTADAPVKRSSTAHSPEPGPHTLLGRELCLASVLGQLDTVKLLLAHSARVNESFRGKTAWQHAMERGHLEIVQLLEKAGAVRAEMSDVDQLIALCMAGDEPGARALLQRVPGLLAQAPRDMVMRAVNTGRKPAVLLALDLGFDPNWLDDNAPIHSAAWKGDAELVNLLLSRGASIALREPWYDGTAIGGAEFFGRTQLRDALLDQPGICLFDALDFGRLDRIPDILARDSAALERTFAECLSRPPKPEDSITPLARMVQRGRIEAVAALLAHGANVAARLPDGRSLVEHAREQGYQQITALLEQYGASA
ncbi:ankyrin repeat domain-containing protein [uncultured Paludibaculum sp.]|uniref:ankyrin repeat domain-containing protein n=1 Tax=uncultured Paludibaculum sp. TaxID=1765020 RepID=UPI002AAA71B1|nr:ankyrin repeat domain-containing protein [uncultured Paludibaculum sp.]